MMRSWLRDSSTSWISLFCCAMFCWLMTMDWQSWPHAAQYSPLYGRPFSSGGIPRTHASHCRAHSSAQIGIGRAASGVPSAAGGRRGRSR